MIEQKLNDPEKRKYRKITETFFFFKDVILSRAVLGSQ